MKASEMSDVQRNAAREQITINTRLTALQCAQDMMKVGRLDHVTASELTTYAKTIEEYILQDIATVKKPSGIVLQTQMPPSSLAADFKPLR